MIGSSEHWVQTHLHPAASYRIGTSPEPSSDGSVSAVKMREEAPSWHLVDGFNEVQYRTVDWANEQQRVRSLFVDYRNWIAEHAEQGDAAAPRVKAGLALLNELIADLPGAYGPPSGEILLWFKDKNLVACGALREQEAEVVELKRIFIRGDYRGEEFGKPFVLTLIARAGALGYRRLRSYALGSMTSALEFYEELGFRRIEPYWPHPAGGAVFFEREVDASSRAAP